MSEEDGLCYPFVKMAKTDMTRMSSDHADNELTLLKRKQVTSNVAQPCPKAFDATGPSSIDLLLDGEIRSKPKLNVTYRVDQNCEQVTGQVP